MLQRAVLLTTVIATSGNAQLRALDTTAVVAAVEREVQSTRSPGASIAIVIGDRVVFERGFGVTNVERDELVTPETLFRIGSVTKVFTGLTAALMSQRGRVKLQEPIGAYARGLDRALQSITLHQLLGHMGGIIGEAADTGPNDDRALGDRVRGWRAAHTFAPPGDVYSYTGPGYWLAGYALEQAAGKWYADLVADEVLKPLGMTRSTFRPTMAMTWPVALDHRVTDSVRVIRPSPNDASTWPSGSLYSSARELSRFAIAFLNGGRLGGAQVIPPEAITMLSTKQGGMPGEDCGYTYGLSTCTRDGTKILSHYGFRVGSGAVFTLVPQHRLAVIILSNRNGGIFFNTERAILDQLLPASQASPAPSNALRGPRAQFAGVYVSGRDTLHFTPRGDSLFYRYGRYGAAAELRTRAEGDSGIVILDPTGQAVQQFGLVRGIKTGNVYLHDGLSAFRRIR